jgi:hypothetical protein
MTKASAMDLIDEARKQSITREVDAISLGAEAKAEHISFQALGLSTMSESHN